jgi:3-oxoacyl-(acyl-carrier-protein) synthase
MRDFSFYIQGMGCISPQLTYEKDVFLSDIKTYDENILTFVTPEYKEWINPIALRRMSRLVKSGLAAAKIASKDGGLEKPDAILSGSGYGCIGDTSNFLNEILKEEERLLTPTFFMQSTYNTISGAIALNMNCNEYNTTYAHRGFAFENALQDSMLQLATNPQKRILVGAFDETNEEQFKLKQYDGFLKRERIHNLDLYKTQTAGTLQGESSTYFVVGKEKTQNTYAQLLDVKTIYAPKSYNVLKEKINAFLLANRLELSDIDILINGIGGDVTKDQWSKDVVNEYFPEIPQLVYKHIIGDHSTASSFGLWVAAKILYHGFIPDVLSLNKIQFKHAKYIFLLNHFWGKRYSFILLKNI